ncbi:hypothetical protein GCM10020360_19500 [Nonlabens tegetincola]
MGARTADRLPGRRLALLSGDPGNNAWLDRAIAMPQPATLKNGRSARGSTSRGSATNQLASTRSYSAIIAAV